MEKPTSVPKEEPAKKPEPPKPRPLTQPERISQALDDLRNEQNHRPEK